MVTFYNLIYIYIFIEYNIYFFSEWNTRYFYCLQEEIPFKSLPFFFSRLYRKRPLQVNGQLSKDRFLVCCVKNGYVIISQVVLWNCRGYRRYHPLRVNGTASAKKKKRKNIEEDEGRVRQEGRRPRRVIDENCSLSFSLSRFYTLNKLL